MKVLLHVCCGPCAIEPFEHLQSEGHQVTAYFYNPNIHPFIEFRRRKKALKLLQERLPIPVIYEEEYGLAQWLREVDWDGPRRCADCYRMRLSRAADTARARGFDAFTTTLLSSSHQKHGLVRQIGAERASDRGIEFLYRDWRPLADENHRRASRLNLYLQNYCGCIFSEWERFRDTSRHVYRGVGAGESAKPEG
ncbi:MAG: epoxyqueuosine reductase QueH [Planctomycetes bacterium]|nr:epoxyqueuosine reductase QueH [Planctomycetota bacterium]